MYTKGLHTTYRDWQIKGFLLKLNTIWPPSGYVACFLNLSLDVLYVICRLHNLRPLLKFHFIYFRIWGTSSLSFGGHMPLVMEWHLVSHWRFLDNHRMNTYADVLKIKFAIIIFKCWIPSKPMIEDVDDSLHLPLSSINRLNQTEPLTFGLLCWAAFFKGHFLLSFIMTSAMFVLFELLNRYYEILLRSGWGLPYYWQEPSRNTHI